LADTALLLPISNSGSFARLTIGSRPRGLRIEAGATT